MMNAKQKTTSAASHEQHVRVQPLQGVSNFRDLGGYIGKDGRKVKWGMLYRSAELSELTEWDMRDMEALGIRTICDLRDEDEILTMPTPAFPAISNVRVPLIPANSGPVVRQAYDLEDVAKSAQKALFGQPDQLLVHLNQAMVQSTAAIKTIFELLLQEDGTPFLFHCTAGKDRTGLIAALILITLGVPRDTIMEDYLLTNQYLDTVKIAAKSKAKMEGQGEVPKEVMKAVMEARPEYLNAALDDILNQYGDVEHYLIQAVGLTEESIAKLQDMLLTN